MSHSAAVIEEVERAFISGTPERRDDMLLRVTDLFLTAPATLTREQALLFDNIVQSLTAHLEHRSLVALSIRLAGSANAPIQLVQRLASNDAIEVAGPLLAGSELLSDQNLVAIAESKSQLHLGKIAERPRLSSTVTDVIVERGDRNVVQKVAANSGASFSRVGMSTLVMRADGDDELIKTIAVRTDISPFVFGQLINYATEQARKHLMAAARPELREALTQIMLNVSGRMNLLAVSSSDWAAAQRLVDSFVQDTELTKAKVLEFADCNKITEMIVALSALSRIPNDLICKLVGDQYGFGAMVLCKAINLNWCATHAVLTVSRTEMDKSSRNVHLEELAEDFDRLSVWSAQRILWYWRGRVKVQSVVSHNPV
jgi:Uncharacterised protein conserved in bacteria (DUF2336)